MGRSMLIIVTSMFLVFSLTQIGVRNRQTQIDQLSVSYAHLSQARNAANAGMELALHNLGLNDSLRAATSIPYAFGNYSASVLILDNSHDSTIPIDNVELRSTGVSGIDQAVVVARIYSVKGLPYVSGAMSIYGNNVNIDKFKSNAFEISGIDCDGLQPALPGMASNTTAGYNSIMNGLPVNSYDNIKGKDGIPSVALDTYMDPASLLEFIQEAKEKRNYTCVAANKQCDKDAGSEHPGTIADPKIMVIQSGGLYDLKQGIGAGIIIVEEGGELNLTGSPEYHGLIIMMGTLKMLNGTPKIFGGMIFSGGNPVLDVDETVTVPINGNANIQYSSLALENIEKKLSVSTATRQYLTYILD